MWLTAPNRIGIASWQIEDSVWRYNISGDAVGPSVFISGSAVSLCHPNAQTLPALDEQFVRTNELHWSFSQAEGNEFGYRLVVRPVEIPGWIATAKRVAFEWIVSVQTSLLDSHPTIDLVLPPSGGKSAKVMEFSDLGAMAFLTEIDDLRVAVILGGRDAPFTEVIPHDAGTRLRLFGQFLEKGVIRRARPWVLIERTPTSDGQPLDEQTLRNAAEALTASPLPLN
ncbi:hypothetical protein [Roseiconus lacunae]|uniref:Uncharacterized protein n=1 Tax=Roseiconus lacunae TaxID=2605694 RepID=A0ABT7PK47_9BACT|nr:hypothetical protein [Roseiconus lacunae]MDM4016863.1 hypothetical protein [Roseiconus lacunae]